MKTALLIIDFINDIIHPDGKIAASANFIKEQHVIEQANKLITFARGKSIPTVFVKVGFSKSYIDCSETSPVFGRVKQLGALQLNTWGTEFHEELNFNPGDFTIVKPRVSAFYATSLEAFLRANQIQHLVIAGVSIDMAVQTTARDAHDRDYKVTVIADACGAASLEVHENVLKLLSKITTITTSEQIINSGEI